MRKSLALAALFLLAPSCATLNKDALAAWTTGDLALMQDLQAYRVVQSKPFDDITAHNAKAFGTITSTEEQTFMAELSADVAADPKTTAARKASLPTRIQAHLNLFTSLKGGN